MTQKNTPPKPTQLLSANVSTPPGSAITRKVVNQPRLMVCTESYQPTIPNLIKCSDSVDDNSNIKK